MGRLIELGYPAEQAGAGLHTARINTLLDFVGVMQPDIAEHDKHISEICAGLPNRHDQYAAALHAEDKGAV